MTNDLSSVLENAFLQFTDSAVFMLQDQLVLYANPQARRLLNLPPESLVNKDFVSVLTQEDRILFQEKLTGLPDRKEYFELHFLQESGYLSLRCHLEACLVDGETIFILECIDNSALVALEKKNEALLEKVLHLSPIDVETHLPASLLLYDRIDQAILRILRQAKGDVSQIQSRLAVVAVQVEGFAQLSKIYPPEVRHYLLEGLVSRFKSSIRSVDTLSKIPGDTFVFLFESIHQKEDVAMIMARLKNCTNIPFVSQSIEFKLSLNMKSAIYPEDGSSAVALIKTATLEMTGS